MLTGATLTADEFKKVHNALINIRGVAERSNNDSLLEQVEIIKWALGKSYEEETRLFQSRSDHYSDIQEKYNLRAQWSVYEIDNLYVRHPYKKIKYLVHKDHWGDEPVVVKMDGDTWKDLFIAADAAIHASGDRHHSFIEGFVQDGENLILQTGS